MKKDLVFIILLLCGVGACAGMLIYDCTHKSIPAIETTKAIEKKDCYYELEPKEDITAYELALLLKYKGEFHDTIKVGLHPAALRHLEEVCE